MNNIPSTDRTLILDLDETLIHSWFDNIPSDIYQIYENPDLVQFFHPQGQPELVYTMELPNSPRIWGLERPNVRLFLDFIHRYFQTIIVWSAGQKKYVEHITRHLFQQSGYPPPNVIWDREMCVYEDRDDQSYYTKPIIKLGNYSRDRNSPVVIDPKKTLILDDRTYTVVHNPESGIIIPQWYPGKHRPNGIPTIDDLIDRSDDALIKVMRWLLLPDVLSAEDVRLLDKSKIFR